MTVIASPHAMGAEVVWRNANNTEQTWRVRCRCARGVWDAPTYEAAEDEWRKHVYEITGKAPKPMGRKDLWRWMP